MTALLMNVAERVFGRPLLCMPEKVEVILAVLAGRLGVDEIEAPLDPLASRFAGRQSDRGPYRITKEGIAVVPVIGTLVNRGAYIGASSGLTSYEGLSEQLKKADKDAEVRGIVLDIDSPGGEAAGTFEIAALIREIRERKRVVAVVNDMACSAAYAIASGAHEIHVTQTGIVGSIGVVLVHFDRSGEMEKAGIKPTIIHAGARKADGNPFGALPKAVKERLQSDVERMRELFIESVVAGRPKLKADAIKATEAGVFMGEAAVDIGLADHLYSSFDSVIESMSRALSKSIQPPAGYQPKLEVPMTDASAGAQQPAAPAQPDPAAIATATANGQKAGRTAERERLKQIKALQEAKDRPVLADHFATETDLSVEAVQKALAAAPKESAAGSDPAAFYKAVNNSGGNPKVPAVGDAAAGDAKPSGLVSGMKKRFEKAGA